MGEGAWGEDGNVEAGRTASQLFVPRVPNIFNPDVVGVEEREARIAVHEATGAVLERSRGGAGKMSNYREGGEQGGHHR